MPETPTFAGENEARGKTAAVRLAARDRVAAEGARTFKWENTKLSRSERVIAFLEELPITKGILRGKKMRLLPRQREFICQLYGTPKGERRPFNLAVKSEPKGNGKTGLVSGITLCHLLGPEAEDRGEIYSAAIDHEQAGILFTEMVAILREIPEYMACVSVLTHRKRINVVRRLRENYPGLGSVYAALSKDAGSAHGLAPSLWVYDELAQAKTRELLDNLINGMGKRDDSLGIVISTQAPTDDHALSQLIDEGTSGANPNTLVFLDAAPDDADPWDPATWKACNPALGYFLNEKEFAIAASRAKANPSMESSFRNLRLNQRVAADTESLVSASTWKKCAVAPYDLSKFEGKVCVAGLDLSKTTDLSALVLVFADDAKPINYDIVPFFWTPADKLNDRHGPELERFREWIRLGLMTSIPGPVVRYDYIAREILALSKKYRFKVIAYDRWRIDDLKLELKSVGIEERDLPLEPFGQGFSRVMAPAIEYVQELALTGRLRHPSNAVLTASVCNAIVIPDKAGNQMLDKSASNRSGPVRIDGAVALTMALGTARRFELEPPRPFDLMFI